MRSRRCLGDIVSADARRGEEPGSTRSECPCASRGCARSWRLEQVARAGAVSVTLQSIRLRRRAIQLTDRAGTAISDLVQLYDKSDDPQMQEAIISTLANNGTKTATDKLLAIAKNDQNYANRRRAVNALGRSEDPRVREALRNIVER